MNIFQLNQELLSIFEELEENGGELTSEIEEQLKINQTDVNNKVESYTQVIAQLNSDIELIKSEKKRLDDLKLSKEKTIESIKKLILYALDYFGETTKSGTKVIDFGTGKVSTRKSVSLEVSEEYDKLADIFKRQLNWAGYVNEIDSIDSFKTLFREAIENNTIEKDGGVYNDSIAATEEDLDIVQFNITVPIKYRDLTTDKAIDLLKAIARDRTNMIEVTPKIDKTLLKNLHLGDNDNKYYMSNLVTKQNVIIK
jgi:hypothetical protein